MSNCVEIKEPHQFLPEFLEDEDEFSGLWYLPTVEAVCGHMEFNYLHSDLVIRCSTRDYETNEYTGYFNTEAEALNTKLAYEEQ